MLTLFLLVMGVQGSLGQQYNTQIQCMCDCNLCIQHPQQRHFWGSYSNYGGRNQQYKRSNNLAGERSFSRTGPAYLANPPGNSKKDGDDQQYRQKESNRTVAVRSGNSEITKANENQTPEISSRRSTYNEEIINNEKENDGSTAKGLLNQEKAIVGLSEMQPSSSDNDLSSLVDSVSMEIAQSLAAETRALEDERVTNLRLRKARLQHAAVTTVKKLNNVLQMIGKSTRDVDKVIRAIDDSIRRNPVPPRAGYSNADTADGLSVFTKHYMKMMMSQW